MAKAGFPRWAVEAAEAVLEPAADDRFGFIFERWARYWLPPGEETGDRRADVARAINRTHARIGGGTLRINTGLVVASAESTLAVLPVEPSRLLPDWLEHRAKIDKPQLFLNSKLADAPSAPSMLIQFSQAAVGPEDLVLNRGSVVSISTAKGAVSVDSLRVTRLAGLLTGLKIDLCRKALALATLRDRGDGGGGGRGDGVKAIDDELDAIAGQLGIGWDRLCDILDAMSAASLIEIRTVAEILKEAKTG
jgi:hypothetical protein